MSPNRLFMRSGPSKNSLFSNTPSYLAEESKTTLIGFASLVVNPKVWKVPHLTGLGPSRFFNWN